ncbi:NAD(P)/FAD-dependent oxidoreductase [Roseibium sp.]|uniref:NAD(P)/FAD-dependent oxidoreductase n=1 Tax=Roseibium sp. TaxID=1936156 RepID=UPI003A98170D
MNIIVIGAGIAGLSTAWALAKKGAVVALLEQGPIPNPLSASGDQHRIIRRAYGGKGGYQKRISEAYDAWDEMWSDIGAKHLVDTGFLLLSQVPGDEGEEYRDGLIEGGYAFDQMTPQETEQRFPFVDGKTIRFGAFSPEGGVLLCQKIAADLRDWLRANDVDVREKSKVTSLEPTEGRVRLENGEELTADRVVVTAGAWVLGLLPQLSVSLTTYRTAVVYLRPPKDLRTAWENGPTILDVGGTVDGYVLPPAAGTGLKFGAGIHKRKSGPDTDRVAAPGEGETLRNHFSPPFGRIEEYAVEDVATCAYTFTADEHFFVKEIGKAVAVSACSGHGYKFGAAIGRRIASGLLENKVDTARIWLEARD